MATLRAEAAHTTAAISSTALLTDHYELTMLEAALAPGPSRRGGRRDAAVPGVLPLHWRRLGYGEGECYVPGSPLLIVEGTFAEAVLLETLVLSVLNHDSAITAAASRMAVAAHGAPAWR